jgi:hypothetical protein
MADINTYLFDDADSESEYGDDGHCIMTTIDDKWINDVEKELLYDEYSDFIKKDITTLPILFVYTNHSREIVQYKTYIASLNTPNQITQDEILSIIGKHQWLCSGVDDDGDGERQDKLKNTYYNFYCMCHYSFYVEDDPKSVALYCGDDDDDGGEIIEYTNAISINTIFFKPLLELFHDILNITIVLYED